MVFILYFLVVFSLSRCSGNLPVRCEVIAKPPHPSPLPGGARELKLLPFPFAWLLPHALSERTNLALASEAESEEMD